jgi:aspartyl-tRNA(Asn)/glutamyl-tRNA(Gln) amidotransferase subunit B
MAEKISVLERYPDYKVDIGIEVHVQLKTNSKIFCSCSNEQTDQPNENICSICSGYPGVLPVLNKDVVEKAIKTGLATNCTIAQKSTFARKHYFYPDLPKNYQITQDKRPICKEGFVTIKLENGSEKKIRLIRIHIEEDAGKNIHAAGSPESFVDLNRTGTPLLEVVTYPDIESVHEVRAYLKALHNIVTTIGASTGNMDEGSFRADTNISVRKKDDPNLGTRCELKNINSFKFITDATEYEIERQIELLEAGEKVIQQTRLWNTKTKETVPMRSKEEAADYRYFQDPDLPIIEVNTEWIERVKAKMPELPEAKLKRLCAQGLTEYQATILIEDRALADYYEKALQHTQSSLLINWVLREVVNCIKASKDCAATCKVTPAKLAGLVDLIEAGTINSRAAQEVFEIMAETGQDATEVVKEKGLEQIGDASELEALVKEILTANPKSVEQYKAGKDKLFGFFVGQAMQKTKGKANPKMINDLLKKLLG